MLLLVSPLKRVGGWGRGRRHKTPDQRRIGNIAIGISIDVRLLATGDSTGKGPTFTYVRLVGKLRSMLEMLGLSMSVCPYQCHIQMTTKAHTAAWCIAIFGSMEANT